MTDKSTEIWTSAAAFAALGIAARAVRYAREHGQEHLNPAKFLICTASAALASTLIGWCMDGLGIDRELTFAAAGAIGYVGGPVLDMLYDEIQATVKAAAAALRKRID